jgi:glycosyltransferase involved in cell wall biosynthesis
MRLFYFTASYPYGLGEQWKANELKVLVKHFDQIIVVPFSYDGNYNNPKTLNHGIKKTAPLFENDNFHFRKIDFFKILVNKYVFIFLKEFFTKKVYRRKAHFMSWLYSSMKVIDILKNPIICNILKEGSKNDVLYFFWGKGSCEILPFINAKKFYKSMVRMHRYDLFEYVNNDYIPYRSFLLKASTIIAPSSIAGKIHLDSLYPEYSSKVKVIRVGTISNGKICEPSSDNILRIVSCSFLNPVKRVHLMIESLKYVSVPVQWYHIGDGKLREDLEKLINKYNLKEKFHLVGMKDSDQVLDFYTSNNFDLFVNVSESEGVPISIMEAYSVGIPVVATNVGGTGEIVNDKFGRLIEKDLTPRALAEYIDNFYNLDPTFKNNMRKQVVKDYEEKWNAIKLTEELANHLMKPQL